MYGVIITSLSRPILSPKVIYSLEYVFLDFSVHIHIADIQLNDADKNGDWSDFGEFMVIIVITSCCIVS